MFTLCAEKNTLTVKEQEILTSGSSNIYQVQFEFSPEWDGLARTAVFQAGGRTLPVLLEADGLCTIPWEVLETYRSYEPLMAGVYGARDGGIVRPTIWVSLGLIRKGADAGAIARPPTPGLYEQLLESLAQKADHQRLTGRDKPEQHPIEAIAGLTGRLDCIPAPVEPLTNEDLEAILK